MFYEENSGGNHGTEGHLKRSLFSFLLWGLGWSVKKRTADEFDSVMGVAVSDLETASNEFHICRWGSLCRPTVWTVDNTGGWGSSLFSSHQLRQSLWKKLCSAKSSLIAFYTWPVLLFVLFALFFFFFFSRKEDNESEIFRVKSSLGRQCGIHVVRAVNAFRRLTSSVSGHTGACESWSHLRLD